MSSIFQIMTISSIFHIEVDFACSILHCSSFYFCCLHLDAGSPDVSRSMPQSSVPLEPTPVPRQKVGSSLVVSHRRLLSETHRSIQECAAACQSWSSSYASCQSPTTGVTGHDTYGQCGRGLAFSAHAMASTTSSIGAASSPLQHQQSLEYTAQSFSQLPSIGALSRPVCNDG